ncbi:cadmium-translocating P-type ATPase [Phyllobacterium brassicacearum]|uniref:P-type Zn(2+) transporter n=1 Tax=Phyllobacterium brassicacearum TaxID=314235 RepID=A0A2P7B998_9HYPH|nr:heavy metal translocating P-type ATPase [Phyllobacterium brassicacearum]PSH63033.1 cadmium-translocating P-type ATPase [Phyllobacterium brassicacearum]TDQ13833.1 heavy metal-(Cd/Co/Hg/Pb/Zn)-translocating P-type ATPase [Phyllobacterium brassicacearum]
MLAKSATSGSLRSLDDHLDQILVVIAVSGLIAGLALKLTNMPSAPQLVWAAATLPVLTALLFQAARSMLRGDFGLDIVAALSMTVALGFGETLAANVVALMYAGGQLLESFASGRAAKEMTALLGRVAQTAMRYRGNRLEEVAIETLAPGDRLLIRHGEVLPVDGVVFSGSAILDQSALTGEAIPIERRAPHEVLSGSTSVGTTFDLMTLRPASESTYAGIVRLVEAAQRSKAPMARLADRYAIGFLFLTIGLAIAAWLLSSDPRRALAVLVVATPCPLILAVPVALVSGLSRSAKAGALIKGGDVLEALSRVRVALLDKTGTVTQGSAEIVQIRSARWVPEAELLRLAASLDQASNHVMAAALVAAAKKRGIALSSPTDVREDAGAGIEGQVEGKRVIIGGSTFVQNCTNEGDPRTFRFGIKPGQVVVAVAIDGAVAGIIVMADQIRSDASLAIKQLRRAGITKIVLATGDRLDVATGISEELGIDEILGDLTPEAKVDAVVAARKSGPVMMVGDGINDAPALASADVGIAMGARGAAASSEAAGVVLLVDKLAPLAQAIVIAQRTIIIAKQSVIAGLGLSLVAMCFAAFGYLPPVQGALLQELIDLAVILNAMRALR